MKRKQSGKYKTPPLCKKKTQLNSAYIFCRIFFNCSTKATIVLNYILKLYSKVQILKPGIDLFYFNPKKAHHGGGHFDPSVVFQICFYYRGSEILVFVILKIIISHIFPENIIEIPQVAQKIWRISLSILAIFINFHQLFEIFRLVLWFSGYHRRKNSFNRAWTQVLSKLNPARDVSEIRYSVDLGQ